MAAGTYQPWMPHDWSTFTNGTVETPEAASLTIKRGTPVVIDTNGRIDAAGTSPTSIIGVSAEDGHNGTAGQYLMRWWPIRPNQIWRMTLLEALAQTTIGDTDAGVLIDATSGYWYASTSDGGAQVRIIDYLQGPAGFVIGDTKATVFVIIKSTKFQAT